jgi:hypothetical protein
MDDLQIGSFALRGDAVTGKSQMRHPARERN